MARNAAHDRYVAAGEWDSDQQRIGAAGTCQFGGDFQNLRARDEDRHGKGDSGDGESVPANRA